MIIDLKLFPPSVDLLNNKVYDTLYVCYHKYTNNNEGL